MKITLFNTTFTNNSNYKLVHHPNGCDQAVNVFCNIDNIRFEFEYLIPQVSFNIFELKATVRCKNIKNNKEFLLRTHVNMDCIYIPNRYSKEITRETVDILDVDEEEILHIPVFAEEWIQIAAAKFEQKFTDYPLGYPFNLLKYSILQ
jgi:hypothetical protein